MSLRKKIILYQILSFLFFFALIFPFVGKIASRLVKASLIESTGDLKDELQNAQSEEALIQLLKEQQFYAFFRISLINDQGLVIFDTHLGRQLGPEFRPYYSEPHVEVEEALRDGIGYVIARSDVFKRRFAYIAEAFPFQGKTYVLRTAFPYQQIQDLTQHFQIGVLIFSFLILLIFSALLWLIFNRLTRPIREITRFIKPVSMEKKIELPEIILTRIAAPSDEFQRLADTFNALSRRIKEQIHDLKEERNEREAILASLGEGVVAINGDGDVLYINAIACKMLKVVQGEIVGKALPEEGGNRELLQKMRDLLMRCQETGDVATATYIMGEESKTYIDLIVAPKARFAGAIVVLQDKTQHYRVVEIGKDFVANASHELRTPITIIKGYVETLHDMPDLPRKKQIEITEKIGRSCMRMETLIKSLLILADIENVSRDWFVKTDLIALLEECRHTLSSVYPDAQVAIEKPEETVIVLADRSLLELALINLLDNAAKYSAAPASISVSVTMGREDTVVIAIADRGQGIPKEDLKHIFHRFYRVDKTHSRRLGGAGLGLSIVQTIIAKHGGTIDVASEVGKGTVFTIVLARISH